MSERKSVNNGNGSSGGNGNVLPIWLRLHWEYQLARATTFWEFM